MYYNYYKSIQYKNKNFSSLTSCIAYVVIFKFKERLNQNYPVMDTDKKITNVSQP